MLAFANPPEVGFFTRYVLENPYPLTVVFAALAAGLAWMALRDARRGPLKAAVGCGVAAIAVVLIGLSVTTSGEHGEAVTKSFVEAVVANDLPTAMNYVANDASLAVGSPQNPGRSIDFIRSRLADLNQRYPIQSNRITTLRGYSERPDGAVVHLACRTAAGGYGPTPSQWILHVRRNADGRWQISQITAVSIGMRTPSSQLW